MKIIHIPFFLILIFCVSCQKNENRSKSHKNQKYYQQLDSIYQHARIPEDPDKVYIFLKKIQKTKSYSGDTILQAIVRGNLAKCLLLKESLDSAFKENQFAIKILKKHKEKYMLQYLSNMTLQMNLYAIKNKFEKSIEICENINYEIEKNQQFKKDPFNAYLLQSYYANAGALYFNFKKFPESLVYHKLALSALSTTNKNIKIDLMITYFNIGNTFNALKNRDSSEYYLKKTLSVADKNDSYIRSAVFGTLAKIHFENNENEKVIYYATKAEDEGSKLNNDSYYEINQLLMLVYEKQHNYKASDKYYILCKKDMLQNESPALYSIDWSEYLETFLLYSIRNQKYKHLDSLAKKTISTYKETYSKESARALEDANIRYQTLAKNDKIAKLNAENALKESNAKRNLYLFLGSLFLFGLTFYFYSRQKKLEKAKVLAENEREKAQSERNKIELEQRLLLSQMNPHFMFNALVGIQQEIDLGNTKAASENLTKFSKLTNMILVNSRDNYISLVDEVKLLKLYLDLQLMHISNKFKYSINYQESPEDANVFIPPMLIQPFIENAIGHGFRNIAYVGNLLINFEKKDGHIICTVDDDGTGIINDSQQHKYKKSHATAITQERLAILSTETGKEGIVKIHNKESPLHGVTVIIKIPIMED